MATGLERIIVSKSDVDERYPGGIEAVRGLAESRGLAATARSASGIGPETSPEMAARHYLQTLIESDDRPTIRAMSAPEAHAPPASQFGVRGERREAITQTDVVSFEQRKDGIPVFGSRAIVELDEQRGLVSASVDMANVHDVDTRPTVSAVDAQRHLALVLHAEDPVRLGDPSLTILPHPDEDGVLHLTWRFRHVPFAPPEDALAASDSESADEALGGCGAHTVRLSDDFDFFIDAHSGELVYLFPNSPHIDVPTLCEGVDEDGKTQTFWGRANVAGFEMENTFEDIWTADMGLQSIETHQPPSSPVTNKTRNWQNANPAAVSAHVNVTRVLDFLLRVLRRNSIDDHGMTLKNIVNCASNRSANPPEWINAVWWRDSMWYGQQSQLGGGFSSLSRFLDIIAHELFHGVTAHTANLVYRGLPGALNESFSDIFGIIVRNWHLADDRGDVGTWSWELGPGLGAGGNPLRNMENPSSVGRWRKPAPGGTVSVIVGYPDHMNDYVQLPATQFFDWGGVHWFSNIHNLAAHNMLTSQRADGTRVFTPEEMAILYYLVLTRLTSTSDFGDARAEMLSVAATVNTGNAARQSEVQQAITNAYDAVGIV